MRDDDLIRRLQKLVALKEHPSTLPAIRDEALRAEQRLHEQLRQGAEERVGRYRRTRGTRWAAMVDDLLGSFSKGDSCGVFRGTPQQFSRFIEDINKETKKLWPKIRPAKPGE